MADKELNEKLKSVEEEQQKLSSSLEEKYGALSKDIEELKKRPVKKRDLWDKVGTLTPLISGVLISGIGVYFTHSSNVTQHKIQEVQTIEKLIPHLLGDETEKKMAIIAISTLTSPETAAKIAQMFPSSGTVQALKSIASEGTTREKAVARKALVSSYKKLGDGFLGKPENDADAANYYEQALEMQEDVYGSSSTRNVDTLVKLGHLSEKQGKYQNAIRYYEQARKIMREAKRTKTSDFKAILHSLSRAYKSAGKENLAKDFKQRANKLGSELDSGSVKDKKKSLINPIRGHYKFDFDKTFDGKEPVDGETTSGDTETNEGSSDGASGSSSEKTETKSNGTPSANPLVRTESGTKMFPDMDKKNKSSADSIFSN